VVRRQQTNGVEKSSERNEKNNISFDPMKQKVFGEKAGVCSMTVESHDKGSTKNEISASQLPKRSRIVFLSKQL
jgi:hypothetical protein